jgi:hypothetical protein
MKRLLAGAVALEMMLGGLALAVLSSGAPGPMGTFTAQRRATPVGDRGGRVEGGSGESGTGRAGGSSADRRRAAEGGSPPGAGAESPEDLPSSSPRRPRDAAKRISFRPPVDFATGATPSSAAFNKKAGEQTALMPLHLALSDSVVTGDFNGDRHADVVQSNVLAGSLSIFLGDGRGGFAAPALHPVGVNPNFVVAGDIDGDGTLDLAVADTGANGVSILRGDGEGGFASSTFLSVRAPRNVAIGRIDGDGIPDLAVASAGPVCHRLVAACDDAPSEGGVHAFVGLGAGAFRPEQFILARPDDPGRIALDAFLRDQVDRLDP